MTIEQRIAELAGWKPSYYESTDGKGLLPFRLPDFTLDLVVQACERMREEGRIVAWDVSSGGVWVDAISPSDDVYFERLKDHNGSHKDALATALLRALGMEELDDKTLGSSD